MTVRAYFLKNLYLGRISDTRYSHVARIVRLLARNSHYQSQNLRPRLVGKG